MLGPRVGPIVVSPNPEASSTPELFESSGVLLGARGGAGRVALKRNLEVFFSEAGGGGEGRPPP